MKRRFLLALPALLMPFVGRAQTPYPTKTVRLMVGANAGGGTDIVARMLAEKLAASLKASRSSSRTSPGASNTIAADLTAKAPPDGHTLLAATNTGQAIAPHLIRLGVRSAQGPNRAARDSIVEGAQRAGGRTPALPVKNGRRADYRAREGQARRAQVRLVRRRQHAAHRRRGVRRRGRRTKGIVHVPYKGSAQAHLDLIGGRRRRRCSTPPPRRWEHIKLGQAACRSPSRRPSARSSELPDLPTLAEAGLSRAPT
jgi:tripartite-type tricarboxylate transporter receptor subunit TctC